MTQYLNDLPKRKNAPGQGRKPTVGGKNRTIYASDADWTELQSLGDGNASAGLRVVLEEHRSRTDSGNI